MKLLGYKWLANLFLYSRMESALPKGIISLLILESTNLIKVWLSYNKIIGAMQWQCLHYKIMLHQIICKLFRLNAAEFKTQTNLLKLNILYFYLITIEMQSNMKNQYCSSSLLLHAIGSLLIDVQLYIPTISPFCVIPLINNTQLI